KFLSLMLAIALSGLILAGCGQDKKEDADDTTTDGDTVEEDAADEEPSGPVAFSEVGSGIMDAADTYAKFTFEDGKGDCYDQGFPTDLYYDSDNVVLTEDGSYQEDMTMIDFTGRITFDEVPLTDGKAECEISTSSGVDNATFNCKIDDAEVCTGNFKVYAHM
ncbi:hypothetical protein ACFL21_05510, partial [Patescibacteria group bacterium]